MNKKPIVFFFFVLTLLLSFLKTSSAQNSYSQPYFPSVESIDSTLNEVLMPDQIKTRVTGYSGYWTVISQVERKFKEIGLVEFQHFIKNSTSSFNSSRVDGYRFYFNVTSPIEEASYVEVLQTNQKIVAHSLWPNLFQTSSTSEDGIEGPLIFAKDGSLESLSQGSKEAGVPVTGSIVVMNYSSGDNWKLAFKFGAKAIIFVEDSKANRVEDERKMINLPIKFTRVFVDEKNSKELLQLNPGTKVKVYSKMKLKNIEACDLIGVLPGKGDLKYEILTVMAHVDSWSAVPAIAPGVDEGLGVVTLIELAKYFQLLYTQSTNSRRTIFFVVTSAHWEGLTGTRELSEFLLFDLLPHLKQYRFGIFVDLSLASDSDIIGLNALPYSTFSGFSSYSSTIYSQFFVSLQKIYYNDVLRNLYGDNFVSSKVLPIDVVNYPVREPLDSEPFAYAGMIVLSLYSAGSFRFHQRTISDLKNFVNLSNLQTQMKAIFPLIEVLTSKTLTELGISAQIIPTRFRESDPLVAGGWGSVIMSGDVTYYDLLKGFYEKTDLIKKDLTLYIDIFNSINYLDPRSHILVEIDPITNPNLSFSVVSLPINIASSYGPVSWFFTAFVVNSTDNSIVYAPDLGDYGNSLLNFYGFTIWRENYFKRIVVFKCGSAVLNDQIDPISFSTFYIDPNIIQSTYAHSLPISIQLLNHKTHSGFTSYFVYQPAFSYSSLAMVFIPVPENLPSEPFEILLLRSVSGRTIVTSILSNSTTKNPDGYGYIIRKGEQFNILYTGFKFAEDTFLLTTSRSKTLKEYNALPYYIELLENDSNNALLLMDKAVESSDYLGFYNGYITLWNLASRSYLETMNTMHDITNTALFFSISLIPTVFILERLIGLSGIKRLFFLVSSYVIASLLMYYLHPGYLIASNIGIALVSFVVMLLAFPVLYIIFNGTLNILKELRTKIVGQHFSEISKGAAFMLAFSFGVENMKRRPLRFMLTLSTLVLVTFSLVSLTAWNLSISPTPITVDYLYGKVPYNGLLLKNSVENEAIPAGIYSYLSNLLNSTTFYITRRAYLIPMALKPELKPSINIYSSYGKSYEIDGIFGSDPSELFFFNFSNALIYGRWFRPSDYDVAIISERASKELNVNVSDKISYGGLELTVIGILNSSKASTFYDLDGKLITPLTSFVESGGTVTYEHISWDSTLIVPYKLSLTFGAQPFSIAIICNDKKLKEIIDNLVSFTESNYAIYRGRNNKVDVYTLLKRMSLSGIEAFIFPLTIAIFAILDAMLGNILERTNEISILSSVGLSPIHIASMFLSESIVYALLGSFIGYMFGLIGIRILIPYFPPNMQPNYSSMFIILSVLLALFATISSSIYPFYKVSKMVTPSLERKWSLPTKPIGDKWLIPLPFEIAPEEVKGLIKYLKEFMEAHQTSLHPEFSVRSFINSFDKKDDLKETIGISFLASLPPYDLGVIQEVSILAIRDRAKNTFSISLEIVRKEGPLIQWIKTNYGFVDAVRKQILLWRSLGQKEKVKYLSGGDKI
jgi:ABC-type antimicrobial peptide transport system permease subunit